jgi:excisionase family DNA binding protein
MARKRLIDVQLPSPEETNLTRLEACRVARMGTTTFDKAVSEGRIRVQRIGRKIIVAREELNRFMGIETRMAHKAMDDHLVR